MSRVALQDKIRDYKSHHDSWKITVQPLLQVVLEAANEQALAKDKLEKLYANINNALNAHDAYYAGGSLGTTEQKNKLNSACKTLTQSIRKIAPSRFRNTCIKLLKMITFIPSFANKSFITRSGEKIQSKEALDARKKLHCELKNLDKTHSATVKKHSKAFRNN